MALRVAGCILLVSRRLFSGRQDRSLFVGTPAHAQIVSVEALSIRSRVRPELRASESVPTHHLYTVHRARRHTQLASRAQFREHRMHLLASAHDGIDRAGRQAFRAANAESLVDLSDQRRAFNTILRVER